MRHPSEHRQPKRSPILRLSVVPDARFCRVAVDAAREVAIMLGLDGQRLEDLALIVGEAFSNAVRGVRAEVKTSPSGLKMREPARERDSTPIDVQYTQILDGIEVLIVDTAGGYAVEETIRRLVDTDTPQSPEKIGGRGLRLIASLADRCAFEVRGGRTYTWIYKSFASPTWQDGDQVNLQFNYHSPLHVSVERLGVSAADG